VGLSWVHERKGIFIITEPRVTCCLCLVFRYNLEGCTFLIYHSQSTFF
jgi:hypothetical protein